MKSKIEWLQSADGKPGYTINPVKGLCPVGCSYCYARRMYKRFHWNPEIRFNQMAFFSTDRIPKGSRVFIGSTMELFGDWIKPEWMQTILTICWQRNDVTWIFLTKKPENLYHWSPFPNNCWVGVSAENEMMAAKGSAWLGKITATVKFLSLEPLLSWDSENAFNSILRWHPENINWLIIGQQTPVSVKTSPKIEWIREIVEAANKAGIPVFLKNNLKSMIPYPPIYPDILLNDDGNLRQEFPEFKRVKSE